MAEFMKLKDGNPRMKQSEIANQRGLSTSTLQRYRNDINMLSPYRINPNINHNEQKMLKILILTTIHITKPMLKDLKGPQMTSKDLN